MKSKLLLPLAIILSAFFIGTTQAQNNQNQKHVIHADNIDAPLTDKERSFINEVYGEFAEADILSKPQRLRDIKNILRNRIEVMKIENKDLSSITNLSSVPLFNPYHKNLSRDTNYNEATFNPLKYQFNFQNQVIILYNIMKYVCKEIHIIFL